MAPLVVSNVFRFSVVQRFEGIEVVNILDFLVSDYNTSDHEEAIIATGEVVLDAWVDNIIPIQTNDLSFEELRYIDLDSLDGPTGSLTSGVTASLPEAGAGGGDPLPGNVSILVTKQVTSARNTRNGRLYLCGMGESTTDASQANNVTAGNQTIVNDAFAGLLADTTEDSSGTLPPDGQLCVVHTPGGGAPSTSLIESFICDPIVATQQRRLGR